MKPSPSEIAENVRSIQLVPHAVLPDGPARRYLISLAQSGADCYCYRAAGVNGAWNLWLVDVRIPVTEYVNGGAHNGQ